MIKDTSYNLELHLQRIDEKLTQLNTDNIKFSEISINLEDEREVTEKCLRIAKMRGSILEQRSRRTEARREAQRGSINAKK